MNGGGEGGGGEKFFEKVNKKRGEGEGLNKRRGLGFGVGTFEKINKRGEGQIRL